MRLSMLHEIDIREAARRVLHLSREQLRKVVGYDRAESELSQDNPYVTVFVSLFQFAAHDDGTEDDAEIHLRVAESVLGSPLYTGPEGETESPLLQIVVAAAMARMKLRRGEPLTPDEKEFFQ